MAIVSTDIIYFYSIGSTGATAAGTASGSLGGTISTTQIGGAANNVWDDVSGAESAAGDTEYRCIYIKNNHGTLALQNAVVWVDVDTPSADTDGDVALDPAAIGSDSTTTIANENTAPAAVTFANTAISKATGLAIGNIPAGSKKAVWLKRVVTAGAAAAADSLSIRVEGDTAP